MEIPGFVKTCRTYFLRVIFKYAGLDIPVLARHWLKELDGRMLSDSCSKFPRGIEGKMKGLRGACQPATWNGQTNLLKILS